MKTADPRHNSRKTALSSLFCEAFGVDDSQQACLVNSKELLELREADLHNDLVESLMNGVKQKREQLDEIIVTCAPDWPIDKIAKIDLIVLRLAIFELLYRQETPEKVVIDEAIELGKEFGAEASSKFVNGVLGTVVKLKKDIKLDAI